LENSKLVSLDFLSFHSVQGFKGCGEETMILLADGFVHKGPPVFIADFAVATTLEKEIDASQVVRVVG